MFTSCGESSAGSQEVDGAAEAEVCEVEPAQEVVDGSELMPEISEQPDSAQGVADEDEESQDVTDFAEYNEEKFYECAEELKIDRAESESCYQRLCDDNVFQNHTVQLASVDIEDLDQNGQPDMMVMVQEDEDYYYGTGCIYFYMNEDEAYCFRDEDFPFFFGFNVVPGDFDGDGNTEIAFESLGTGCGGAGDWHPRILKYRDHTMVPMDFPYEVHEDSNISDWRGVDIYVTQEEQADTYSAYCAYLDDTIVFEADNVSEPEGRQVCGGNCRGYFNLWRGEYEGKDALEVSEILFGEGGTVHSLALAKFLIVWDENGDGKIVKWWVES